MVSSTVKISQDGMVTLVEGIRYADGKIAVDDGVVQAVRNKEAIIFKRVFPKELVHELRRMAVEFPFRYANYQDCGNGLPGCFKRYDDLVHRDFAARRVQLFGFFFWDSEMPEPLLRLAKAWGAFVNRLRGFNENTHFDLNDEFVFSMNGYHYPATGFLGKHHAKGVLEESAVKVPFTESVIYCSEYNKDFKAGGLYLGKRGYDDSGELFNIEPYFECGDVFFFVNDLHHEVKPIDPERPLDLDPMKGRFIFCLVSYAMKDVRNFITPC